MRTFKAGLLGLIAVLGTSWAGAAPRVSPAIVDRAQIVEQFRAMGFDPATVVFQSGPRNYAGPSCPGEGWTCTQSGRGPVVQTTDGPDAMNVFECTGSSEPGNSCVIVQTSVATSNVARCILSASDNPVTQSCSITQHNQTGRNDTTVDMNVTQEAGAVHSATQTADVLQRSTSGNNQTTARQKIRQSADSAGSGALEQTQTAGQSLTVDQGATLDGRNGVAADQNMIMQATTSGGSSVVQRQNATSTGPDQSFDVVQASGTGANGINVSGKIDQKAVANQPPLPTDQQQGTEDGGQYGAFFQSSSGLSTATISQDERQHALAHETATQNQFGPHVCCDGITFLNSQDVGAAEDPDPNQIGNANNRLTITQSTTQNGDGLAHQDDLAIGRFNTSGFGTVTQKVSQNGVRNSNTCSGQICDTRQSCIDGFCDNTPPETTITSGPSSPTQSRSASFTFESNEANSTFECLLDGGTFTPCTSPTSYSGLADGTHTFLVRATDPAGNTDPTPASWVWTVDGTGPQSDFDPGQDGQIFIGDPLVDSQITGTATDATSGVAEVKVTFTHLSLGTVETVAATLTCNPGATSCDWTVSVPSTPGQYRATKSAKDEAGNIEVDDGESITFIVIP